MKSTEAASELEEKRVAEEISPKMKDGFPIVGIGSSAGGLEALGQFLKAMPDHTGMAFIIIQHTSNGTRTSMLPEILQKWTPMTVYSRHLTRNGKFTRGGQLESGPKQSSLFRPSNPDVDNKTRVFLISHPVTE